jgi:hypothetical protein
MCACHQTGTRFIDQVKHWQFGDACAPLYLLGQVQKYLEEVLPSKIKVARNKIYHFVKFDLML